MNRTRNSAVCTFNWIAFLILILWLNGAVAAGERSEIQVFSLAHRDAGDLVETLRPLVAPDGAISASGSQLIVRSSPSTLRQISKLIAQLDVSARQYLISVQSSRNMESSHQASSASGSLQWQQNGADVQRNGSLRLYGTQSSQNEAGAATQQIRALEGQWAQLLLSSSAGGGAPSRTPPSAQGFSLLARAAGEKIQISIAPLLAPARQQGQTSMVSAQTVLEVNPGVWTDVAALDTRGATPQETGTRRDYSTSATRLSWRIKVEPLP